MMNLVVLAARVALASALAAHGTDLRAMGRVVVVMAVIAIVTTAIVERVANADVHVGIGTGIRAMVRMVRAVALAIGKY